MEDLAGNLTLMGDWDRAIEEVSKISLFRDHRRWEIGMGICDICEIGQGFSDGRSLNNHKFVVAGYGRLDWEFVYMGYWERIQ